ncbi:MAG: restriction endonuclease subunit S [Acidiferrobacteraceae bacterium]
MKLNSLVESDYALPALKAGFFLTWITAMSGSTAQQAIYIREIRSLLLPLPPLAEQQFIVADIDRRLSQVREVETQVDTNLTRTERLRQTILGAAFSGQMQACPKTAPDTVDRNREQFSTRTTGPNAPA